VLGVCGVGLKLAYLQAAQCWCVARVACPACCASSMHFMRAEVLQHECGIVAYGDKRGVCVTCCVR
jgi:hypothetical protein